MAFDGIVTKKIVSELNSSLTGGKINKIYEPNKNEIILGIYCNGKNYALNIDISSNNYRVNLTTNAKPNPINALSFCMVLRKHLIGFKIKNIYTISLERIIFIDLEGYNELNDLVSKKLIIELMGKHSNIILVNNKNIIIDSLRHLDSFSNSYRDILPAREYVLPNSDKKDILNTSFDEFSSLIGCSISESIPGNFTGISKIFVLNLLNILNICDDKFELSQIELLYNTILWILNNISSNDTSCILLDTDDYIISKEYNNDYLQCNFFLDDFYLKKENKEIITNYKNNLLRLVLSSLKKITKKITNIDVKLKECSNMDTYRMYGELLTSNLYKIDNSKNIDSIILEDYYNNNSLITIPLDKTISPSYNAKKYFKKYHKLKNTLEIVTNQKIEAQKELDYLESIVYELDNADCVSDLDEIYNEIYENSIFKNTTKSAHSNVKKNKVNKRKTQDEYEPLTYNIDGFTLFVGKNNKQNDYITTKLGKNEDLWFHTKDIRGSHCLLKCNGSQVKSHTITTCAQIAAFHSKAKLSSNVPVDYCFSKNVKKPSGSKPGMVIYTNNKTLYVNPSSY